MGAALAVLGLGTSLIGGIEQAQGQVQSAKAQAESYAYQAQIAKNNAAIAGQNVAWVADQGEIDATTQGMKTAAEVGSMKAKEAASGIDVNTGSAVDARAAAERLGVINALTVKSNAARTAWGYQVDQSNEEIQSALYKKAGAYATQAGKIGAGSTLLATAGSIASQAAKYSMVGGGISPGDSSYPGVQTGSLY